MRCGKRLMIFSRKTAFPAQGKSHKICSKTGSDLGPGRRPDGELLNSLGFARKEHIDNKMAGASRQKIPRARFSYPPCSSAFVD
jgi:hypothetical protein